MPGPLEGFRMIDLTTMISGPFATVMRGDQGADIVKVESPGAGDLMHYVGPSSSGVAEQRATMTNGICNSRYSLPSTVCCLLATMLFSPVRAESQEVAGTSDTSDVIEEIVVQDRRVKMKISPVEMGRIRDENGEGGRLYRQGRYEEAFPLLLTAARHGFKIAQARVSFLYQQGLGVQRNAEAAIGWLGVAASSDTSPQIRNYYKRFMAGLPDTHREAALTVIDAYIEKYGDTQVGVFCDNERIAGKHVSALKCDFKDEFQRDGLESAAVEGAIALSRGQPVNDGEDEQAFQKSQAPLSRDTTEGASSGQTSE